MSRVFDAFALPRGFEPPERAMRSLEAGPMEVRFGDWDAEWVGRLADALAGRRADLAARSAANVLESLARVGARFRDPDDPVRWEALEVLPATSGLSPEMSAAVLDGMSLGWSADELGALVEAELGSVASLDGFRRAGGEVRGAHGSPAGGLAEDAGRGPCGTAAGAGGAAPSGPATMPVGPRLCVQIVSGSVPGVGVNALIRSLLVKGPTLLKAGRGDLALPVLFGRALREVDPALADALAVVYWPGGSVELEDAAIGGAEVVVAYGSDAAVRALRERTPVTTRFVAYHHRVSAGVVGRDALAAGRVDATASEVAAAVAFFDQRGCVSPQVVYVEEDDEGVGREEGAAGERSAAREGATAPPGTRARMFASRLACAFEELEARLPGGALDAEEASAVQQLRGTAELMAASGSSIDVMHGGGSSWTVLYEARPGTLQGCVGRVVRVRPLVSLGELPGLLEPLRHHLQTVGTAGLGERAEALATDLGRLGVSRVTPFASVPFPPARWHHDGGRPLGDLVRWVDLERE